MRQVRVTHPTANLSAVSFLIVLWFLYPEGKNSTGILVVHMTGCISGQREFLCACICVHRSQGELIILFSLPL